MAPQVRPRSGKAAESSAPRVHDTDEPPVSVFHQDQSCSTAHSKIECMAAILSCFPITDSSHGQRQRMNQRILHSRGTTMYGFPPPIKAFEGRLSAGATILGMRRHTLWFWINRS